MLSNPTTAPHRLPPITMEVCATFMETGATAVIAVPVDATVQSLRKAACSALRVHTSCMVELRIGDVVLEADTALLADTPVVDEVTVCRRTYAKMQCPLQETLRLDFSGHVHDLQVSPCGRMCYVGCDDGILRVWNTETGRVVRETKVQDYTYSVAALMCMQWVFCGGGGIVRLDSHEDVMTRISENVSVDVLRVSRCNEYLLSGSGPHTTVAVHNLEDCTLAWSMEESFTCLTLSQCSRWVLMGNRDSVCLMTLDTGAKVKEIDTPNVFYGDISPCSQFLLANGAGLRMLRIEDGTEVRDFAVSDPAGLMSSKFSPCGKWELSRSDDGVSKWDVHTGECTNVVPEVDEFVVSPCSTYVIYTTVDLPSSVEFFIVPL